MATGRDVDTSSTDFVLKALKIEDSCIAEGCFDICIGKMGLINYFTYLCSSNDFMMT